MDADYDIFEIVKVIHDFRLFDAESYQRNYCSQYDQPLEPGFYVVNWPEQIRARRFNEYARYHGPFNLRKEAQDKLEQMRLERENSLKIAAGRTSVAIPISARQIAKHTTLDSVQHAKVA
jgi:hypothetical protein